MTTHEKTKVFIDRDGLYDMVEGKTPGDIELQTILNKALQFKGLNLIEVASLLRATDPRHIDDIMKTARLVKEHIYGRRLVFFAPLYTGNVCVNNCLYCAFRRDNASIKRKVLSMVGDLGRSIVLASGRSQEDPFDLRRIEQKRHRLHVRGHPHRLRGEGRARITFAG